METTVYQRIQKANIAIFEGQIMKSRYPILPEQTLYVSGWGNLFEYEVDTWDEEKGILTIKRKAT